MRNEGGVHAVIMQEQRLGAPEGGAGAARRARGVQPVRGRAKHLDGEASLEANLRREAKLGHAGLQERGGRYRDA